MEEMGERFWKEFDQIWAHQGVGRVKIFETIWKMLANVFTDSTYEQRNKSGREALGNFRREGEPIDPQ